MIFHQWRRTDQAPAEQRARILAEQEAIAARKKLDRCPGLALEDEVGDLPPAPYRRRAAPLDHLHPGHRPWGINRVVPRGRLRRQGTACR